MKILSSEPICQPNSETCYGVPFLLYFTSVIFTSFSIFLFGRCVRSIPKPFRVQIDVISDPNR